MSTTETDLYELLGVSRDADGATIKSAYRKLAMKHHPDRNPGCTESEGKFKAVSAAYEVLKDPQKRAAYDRFGHAAFQQGGPSGGGHPGADFGDIGDIFETIFGGFAGGGGGRQQARRGRAGAPALPGTFSGEFRAPASASLRVLFRGQHAPSSRLAWIRGAGGV